jgi:hypothetical protein
MEIKSKQLTSDLHPGLAVDSSVSMPSLKISSKVNRILIFHLYD